MNREQLIEKLTEGCHAAVVLVLDDKGALVGGVKGIPEILRAMIAEAVIGIAQESEGTTVDDVLNGIGAMAQVLIKRRAGHHEAD